jgi:hypothetical protein
MHPHRPVSAPPSSSKAPLVIGLAALVACLGGAAGAVFFLVGSSRGEDVGDLPELARVQALLMPLDACKITYESTARRDYWKYLHVAKCSDESFPPSVAFAVDPTWRAKHITFTATRSSPSDRWTIRVDKSAVAFPDLRDALDAIAPQIAKEYPARLATTLAESKKAHDDYEAAQAERARAAKRAKESYPSR